MTEPTTTERRAAAMNATNRAAAMNATNRAAAASPRGVLRPLALAAAVVTAAAALAAPGPARAGLPGGLELVVREQPGQLAGPEAPALGSFPIQLVLDDGSAEGTVGVADMSGAREFLWFNRFEQPPGPGFVLEEVWVLFPADPNLAPGDAIELAVYQDPDGDPTNGADLLATFDVTVQVADGATFSVYPLASPVTFTGTGDVLIGAVPRFIEPGDPLTAPAAIDNTTSQGRSWLAIWSGDPPDDPELPPDSLITTVDDLGFPGNWMIRGFGSELPVLEIPAVGGPGLAGLAALLALAGLVFLVRRRSRVTGTLALAFLLVTAASAGAVPIEIDPFTTVHGPLSAPPTSISTAGPGAMIAAFRDLEIERLSGTGTSTVEVAGGVLTFTAAAGDRARISVLYDGEPTTAFDPSIVPPFNMIGFDHGSFRLRAAVTGNPASAVFEVYTDAANWSRAALALPVGAMADHFVDLSELQVAGGTGADLTQVRGLVFRIVAEDGAVVTVEEFFAEPPAVAAAQADFTDAGAPIGGGSVVPGETFRYRVTIDNTGGAAEGLDLSNVLDPALVPGTFRTTPVVRPDQYVGFGNVDLVVDGVGLPDLVANDVDPDGDPVNVVPAVDLATAQGGEVDVAADGTFTYTPPAGFTGVDTFTYTVAPVAGDPTEDASGNPVGPFTGTVSIALDRTVWFVDNTHGGPFEGTQANPFAELKDAEAASGPGDVIRLRRGDGTTTGYDLGMIMKDGQHLIGGGVPLVIDGQTIEPADPGGRPKVTHGADGHALELASEHVIHGVDVEACDRVGLWGFTVGHVEVREMTIVDAGAEAVLIDDGDLDVELDGVSSNGSATSGLRLANVTGTLTVSGSTTIQAYGVAGGDGLVVTNSPGAVLDFGTTTIDGNAPLGGNGVLGTGGDGVSLVNNAGATITFDSLDVTSVSGAGLVADNAGTVNVNSTAATIDATGGPAVDIRNGTAGQTNGISGWTFQSLSSNASLAEGVRLHGLTDGFTVGTGTTVTGAAAGGILVLNSSGLAFDFGAASVTSTGDGVNLEVGNGGSGFAFDSLNVVASAGSGLRGVMVSVGIGGTGNLIDAAGGAALAFENSTLGTTALTGGGAADFATLSSSGSPFRGINLVEFAGGFTAAGGAISGAASNAFHLDGGSPTIVYGGTVTQNNAARAVNLEDTTAGSVSFTAKVTGGAASTGVRVHNADGDASFADLDLGTSGSPMTSTALTLSGGSAGTFSFADTQIFTTTATGIDAQNGGTVQVTGPGNRVTTTQGVAILMVGGTAIGASGVTFQRVDSSNAANGIVLAGTGGAGFFEVTGDGASDPTDTTRGRTTAAQGGGTLGLGSGGSITNSIGPGVSLASTTNVALRNMVITDATNAVATGEDGLDVGSSTNLVLDNLLVTGHAGNHGIDGAAVSGFSMIHSEVHSNATAVGTSGPDIWNLRFDDLSGTASIRHSLLHNSLENIAGIINTTGSLNVTVENSEFRDTAATAPGNVGLLFDLTGSAEIHADVSGSSFLRNFARGVQYLSNSGSTRGSVDVRTSVFEENFVDVDVAHQSAGQTVTFDIDGNTHRKTNGCAAPNDCGNAINAVLGGVSAATTTLSGTIQNNDVGAAGIANSGSTDGDGIFLHSRGDGTMTVRVENNTVRSIRQQNAFRALVGEGDSTLNLTFSGPSPNANDFDVNAGAFPLYGIDLTAGTLSGDSPTVRVNFADPSRAVGDATAAGMQLQMVAGSPTVELQGYGGPNCTPGPSPAGCDATVAAFLDGANTTSPTPAFAFIFAGTVTGTVSATGGTVPTP